MACLLWSWSQQRRTHHYNDVITSEVASWITSVSIVCSTVGPGKDQSKHQSSASLAFVWGIHRWPVNSPRKRPVTRKIFPFDDGKFPTQRPVTRKIFPFDDVIMTWQICAMPDVMCTWLPPVRMTINIYITSCQIEITPLVPHKEHPIWN